MVVRVYASEQTRRARLAARRPPLTEPELTSRMSDVSPELLPPADHVVPNDPHFQELAEWNLLQLFTSFRFGVGGEPLALGRAS